MYNFMDQNLGPHPSTDEKVAWVKNIWISKFVMRDSKGEQNGQWVGEN